MSGHRWKGFQDHCQRSNNLCTYCINFSERQDGSTVFPYDSCSRWS